ncbi:MAG: ribonuclease III [Candidatus Marinimicrobia bacterium]|nr:ribonuclease III [Candidatus Neomarinimicrobiota bacterium]
MDSAVTTPFWLQKYSSPDPLAFSLNIFKKRYPTGIEKKIGYLFKHPDLLSTALTHRSAALSQSESYERLEFLGDAVLDMVVSDYLYKKYPHKPEGELTMLRSILVNGKTLYEVASSINLQDDINVDKSLDLQCSSTLQNLLSSTLESIVGAIYLDRGLKEAGKFIKRFIITRKEKAAMISDYNYKGQLLEYCQKTGCQLPVFKTENIEGPDHARQYTIAVFIDNQLLGKGIGATKRDAEQQAAEKAYKLLIQNK